MRKPIKSTYKPTEEDKAFMLRVFGMLRVGGVWSYLTSPTPIAFEKVDERTLACVAGDESVPGCGQQVRRCKATIEACGLVFLDRRPE